jgi:hypothetical protein
MNYDRVPRGLKWMQTTSFFHAGYEALLVNELRYLQLIEHKVGSCSTRQTSMLTVSTLPVWLRHPGALRNNLVVVRIPRSGASPVVLYNHDLKPSFAI